MVDIKRTSKAAFPLAGLLAITTVLVSWLFSKINLKVTALMSGIPLTTAFTSTLGSKVIHFIDGYLPLTNLQSLVMIAITAFILLVLGMLTVEITGIDDLFKKEWEKLASIIVIGSLYAYLLAVGLKFEGALLLGLGIYAVALSLVAIYVIVPITKVRW